MLSRGDNSPINKSSLLVKDNPLAETAGNHVNTLKALEACADWAWETDREGRITYISESVIGFLGYPPSACIGKRFTELPGVRDHSKHKSPEIRELMSRSKPFRNLQLEVTHRDGRLLMVSLNGYPLADANHNGLGYRGIGIEATETAATDYMLERVKKSVSDKVGESYFEALTREIMETLNIDYVFVARMEDESQQTVTTLSVSGMGNSAKDFSYCLTDTPDFEASRSGTLVIARDAQQKYPADIRLKEMAISGYACTPLYGTDDRCIGLLVIMSRSPLCQVDFVTRVVELFADRTAAELMRSQVEETLLHQAYSDSLTGLANRPLAMDRLEHAIRAANRSGRRLYVLFLDLDGFKYVNDTMGHVQGDILLQEVASRFSATIRDGETLARLGGDEFLVILEETEVAAGEFAARRLLESLAEPIILEGREFEITASIGVAQFPEDGENPESLMRNADTAMYQAKRAGCNTYRFFTSEMNEQIRARIELETRLWHALENEEFRLFYQPIIELATGKIVGAEALLRWDSQEYGLVTPDRFITLAEDIGVTIPLGEWIVSQACSDCKRWRTNFSPAFTVTVNVSPGQFRDRHILNLLNFALEKFELPRDAIQLDVTENLIMQDVQLAQDILTEVTDSGTKVSIDDFGTGFSSLSYLKDFPFTNLKIDQSFITRLRVNSNEATLVSTMIGMAHNMELQVVAEGIETPQQLSMLAGFRCDLGQGYYFSKPLPAEQFQRLLYKGVIA
jgi:diguanylate cyclase (GGDEF)-like protein/PAS domain S-box-containing protein